MLGLVVLGSRTWMCTIAAPALAASRQELAICSGVTGTAGFLPGVSAEPVTAQEIITFRAIFRSLDLSSGRQPSGPEVVAVPPWGRIISMVCGLRGVRIGREGHYRRRRDRGAHDSPDAAC